MENNMDHLKAYTPSYSQNGTSYHGVTIDISAEKLFSILGEETEYDFDGKSKYTWVRKTTNGNIFTVYDSYGYIADTEEQSFHIGGFNVENCIEAKKELCKALGVEYVEQEYQMTVPEFLYYFLD